MVAGNDLGDGGPERDSSCSSRSQFPQLPCFDSLKSGARPSKSTLPSRRLESFRQRWSLGRTTGHAPPVSIGEGSEPWPAVSSQYAPCPESVLVLSLVLPWEDAATNACRPEEIAENSDLLRVPGVEVQGPRKRLFVFSTQSGPTASMFGQSPNGRASFLKHTSLTTFEAFGTEGGRWGDHRSCSSGTRFASEPTSPSLPLAPSIQPAPSPSWF